MDNSPLGKINFFIGSYIRLIAGIFKSTIWFPFLILAFFQAFGLLAFSNFYATGLNQFLYPLLSKLYPPAVFHYPQYYLVLPHIFSAYDRFILGPTIGIIMIAVAVYKLGGYKRGARLTFGEGFTKALKSYLPLLLFWIIITGIILIVLWGSAAIFEDHLAASPRARLLAGYGFYLIAFILTAFLVYTIPGIIISGKRIGDSLKDSIWLCGSNFFLTFFIIAIPGSVTAAIDLFVAGFSPQIITLFNPGLMTTLLYIRIAIGIFVNLFIYGAAVFVYIETVEG